MDNSPLNEAHYHHRRAEASMRKLRYDDAIEHHKRAVTLLEKSFTKTSSGKALESLRLQRDYHIRQQTIITTRKEREKEIKRKHQEKHDPIKKKEDLTNKTNMEYTKGHVAHKNIKAAVNQTMDDADSLLLFLVKRQNQPNSLDENDVAFKEPKNVDTVIEELQTVNHQLRSFITDLFQQLEDLQLENQMLKLKLKDSIGSEENDTLAPEESPQPSPPVNNIETQFPLIMTDSAGDNLSPFVFSPGSDLSPEDTFNEIKELPPLELPNFDFANMMSELKAKRDANKDYLDQNGS